MKFLTFALLLTSCSTMTHNVKFLDAVTAPDVDSAHVCLIKSADRMECISLESFLRLAEKRHAEKVGDL